MIIDTVIFDMGGTLEDIQYSKEAPENLMKQMLDILEIRAEDIGVNDLQTLYELIIKRYKAYKSFREETLIEANPQIVWGQWILKDLNIPKKNIITHSEELAYFWETKIVTRNCRADVTFMLEELKSRDIKLGIISNTASFTQVYKSLDSYNISHYFDCVSLSSEYGVRKPHEYIFYDTLKKMQTSAKSSVYVGDTISRDIIGAKNADIAIAIQIISKFTKESDKDIGSEHVPDYIISNFKEVVTIIDQINYKKGGENKIS